MEKFTLDDEFLNPNINYQILITELRKRLTDLQNDMMAIKDPELLGFAQKIYSDLKIKYFNLLRDDLDLQHKFATQAIIESIDNNMKVGEEHDE